MLDDYKKQNFIESSLNASYEFFNNTLKTNQKYSFKELNH